MKNLYEKIKCKKLVHDGIHVQLKILIYRVKATNKIIMDLQTEAQQIKVNISNETIP